MLESSTKKGKIPQQTFKKSNQKTLQINMSTLSTAQKQLCIKLLAQSNLNFQQNNDGFQTQLRIDPNKFTSQFCTQKQSQPNVSPIKKRQQNNCRNNKINQKSTKQKQNISSLKNKPTHKTPNKTTNKQAKITKKVFHPIYSQSKKLLSKTVKINNLTELQQIHPQVQLYIYAKKLPFQSMIQLIEQIYDYYWKQQITNKNKQSSKQKQTINTRNPISQHHNKQTRNNITSSNNRCKPVSKKPHQPQQPSSNNNKIKIQQQKQQKSFCQWVYTNFIIVQKEKLKVQQLLVNFIQSLNHFSYKHLGVQIFYNFFSGVYQLEALNYFLVIRTLLEQIYDEKIIEKVSNYGSKNGVLYKMKLNPYQKFIQQEKIYDFLEVCCCAEPGVSLKQNQQIKRIFNQMTLHMFFDEKKKKNFIHFHEMVEILMKQFTKIDTVNTTNLQLSFTQGNETLNDFLFNSQQQIQQQSVNHPDQDLELTFQVIQNKANPSDTNHLFQQEQTLNGYLPEQTHSQLLQPQPQQQKQYFQSNLYQQLLTRYTSIKKSLCGGVSLQNKNSSSSRNNINMIEQSHLKSRIILNNLYQSIIKCDKKKWIECIKSQICTKNNSLSPERQQRQLLFVQKLQMEYLQLKNCNIISNQFIKKFFTASCLRQKIVQESGVRF